MDNTDIATSDTGSRQAGASSPAGSRSVEGQQPPQNQPATPDINKAIADAIQADRTKYGRDDAALKKREQAIKEAEARRQQEQEEQELSILEEATKENPEEKPKLLDFKKKLADEKRAFNSEKSKMQPILDVINELGITDAESLRKTIEQTRATNFELVINKAATENQVDATVLKDKAKKLGLTDESLIKELASSMPKKAVMENIDSGKTAGGGIDISKLTPEQKIKYAMEHPKR